MSKSTKMIAALGIVAGLGVAALPLGAASALNPTTTTDDDSQEVDINMTINSGLALSIPEAGRTINATVDGGGNVIVSANTTVITASGNAKNGFNVTAAGTGGTENSSSALTNANGKTVNNGAPAQGTSAWGIRVGGEASTLTGFTALGDAGTSGKLINTNAAAADQTATIYYGFSATADQEVGEYSGQITYTIAANSD